MVSHDTYNVFIAVYMMASSRRTGTIYIGATSHLPSDYQHREGRIAGFTKKYGVKNLVWYEPHEKMTSAIQRETSLKKYSREWKINLIEQDNPDWDDLYPNLVGIRSPKVAGIIRHSHPSWPPTVAANPFSRGPRPELIGWPGQARP